MCVCGGGASVPDAPGKSQVAICRLRNTGTDFLEKQLDSLDVVRKAPKTGFFRDEAQLFVFELIPIGIFIKLLVIPGQFKRSLAQLEQSISDLRHVGWTKITITHGKVRATRVGGAAV